MQKTVLGQPVFHYETDSEKAKKATRNFWKVLLGIITKDSEKKSA